MTRVALLQLDTSRRYKAPRMAKIKEYEDMYFGIVPKQLRNPFNDDYGFLGGFVDFLVSEVDDPPILKFGHQELADAQAAMRVSAAFDTESRSPMPNAQWPLKDRWAKRLATFSGRGIYCFYAEANPKYKSNLEVIDHYDFHCEPSGGGLLENHLFCGNEGVFKTKEELVDGAKDGYYDTVQVDDIVNNTGANDYKEVQDQLGQRNNRHQGLGLDPQTNNYTGQAVFKLIRWFMTYNGKRYYLLIDEHSKKWIRVKELKDVFKTGLYPYSSFATHEDPAVFWSKSPCDTAFPIGKNINRFLNQEMYNREKINLGREFYDPTMITDLESLINPGPDRKIPVDTKNGQRPLNSATYRSQDGELTGTIDLVNFLDAFGGRKSGSTPGSQGGAERDKKVGIFFGEIQQVKNRLGTLNKSYREAWQELGIRYMDGLDTHLKGEMPIKLMGSKGVEWSKLTRADLKRNRPFDIIITGGSEEDQLNEINNQKKLQALGTVTTVNPRWKDRQALKSAGWSDDEIKDAFSPDDGASLELISEAAQAVQDIVKNKEVELNQGANAAFMQKLIDQAQELGSDIPLDVFNKIIDFAIAHTEIAARNESQKAGEMIRAKGMASLAVPTPDPTGTPTLKNPMQPAPNPMQSNNLPIA